VELGDAVVDPSGTARDSKDGAVTLVREPVDLPSTLGTYTLTYTAIDKAGNKASATRKLTIQDTIPPAVTLVGGTAVDLEFKTNYQEQGYSVVDQSEYTVVVDGVSQLNTASQQGTSPGPFSITYTVCDAGSLCTTKIRQVYLEDNVVPLITLKGTSPTVVEVNTLASYVDAGATAADNVHGDLSVRVVVAGVAGVDVGALGTYVVTYDLTYNDEVARQATRQVIVRDTTKPSVTLAAGALVTVEMGNAWSDPGFTAADNYNTPAELQIVVTPSSLSTLVANGTILTVR
jgi:hypothetical protein